MVVAGIPTWGLIVIVVVAILVGVVIVRRRG
jgi:F0F1-type ATP synthase assembly protein I